MVEDRVLLVAMVGRHRLEQMGSSGERFYSLGEGAEGRVSRLQGRRDEGRHRWGDPDRRRLGQRKRGVGRRTARAQGGGARSVIPCREIGKQLTPLEGGDLSYIYCRMAWSTSRHNTRHIQQYQSNS